MTVTFNFDDLKILKQSPLEILKNRYIQKNDYLKKSFEKITIEQDNVNRDEIYNDIRSNFDDEDEQNPRYLAKLMVYENKKDFFFLERDMRFSCLMLAFHTFEKDLKNFIFKSISDIYQKDNSEIIKIILKDFCFDSSTDKLFKFLPKIYPDCLTEQIKKLNKIRNLVNAFKHNENKAKKDCPNFLKTLDIFDKNFISYEDAIEKFLYITKDDLFGFIDNIIEFWNKIPILQDIDSLKIDKQIKDTKKQEKGTKNDRSKHPPPKPYIFD